MDESKSLSYLQFNFLMYLKANYSNYFCFKMALWPVSAMISFSVYRDFLLRQGHSTQMPAAYLLSHWASLVHQSNAGRERWLIFSQGGYFFWGAHARQFYFPEGRTLQPRLDLQYAFWSNAVRIAASLAENMQLNIENLVKYFRII